MSEETLTHNSIYTATVLKKLVDLSADDPSADDLRRLHGNTLEIALTVLGEGRDKQKRAARLRSELESRGLSEFFQPLIDNANASADLSSLKVSSGWDAFDLADVMTENIPPIEWIVRYFLPRPSVIVFYGRPKAKKTLIVLDLCHHIANGLNWMTSNPNGNDGIDVRQARVTWVDLENGTQLMKRRMRAFAKAIASQTPRGQFMAWSMPDPWLDLSKPENVIGMIERINAIGNVGVMVIDHLGQVFGSVDENSPLASQVMGAIRQISEATNTAIILIHHAKKGQGKDGGAPEDMLRGSGAILAGVDAAFMVERDQTDRNAVTVKPVAVRGPDAPNISAQFSYEQDENLDLISARFWRIAYRSVAAKARDAILQALQGKKLNHTQLRAEAKKIDSSLSDATIREGIITLEGTSEIFYTTAAKGAKIYSLESEDEDD